MLTIEPPIYQVRGTTIFRDHLDPDLFYVLPTSPALVIEAGRPGLTLYKYRSDLTVDPLLEPTKALGGGIAMFDVETIGPAPPSLVADLPASTRRSGARVTPVLFRACSVHSIVAHTEGDGFVADIVESTVASVAAPHRASFAMRLTPQGATLFEQAARGGQLPVGVAYEMKFLALTPALHATVSMDDDRAYERFAGSAGFSYYVNARLDAEVARLEQDGIVKIEIDRFTDEDDHARQHRMLLDLVTARIQQDFFRAAVPKPPAAAAGGVVRDMVAQLMGAEITSASAYFVLKAKYEVVREDRRFELHFDGRSSVELTHVTTAGLTTR